MGTAFSLCASAQTDCLPPAIHVMTVVFPTSLESLGGPALQSGDAVQAYDPRGQCVGELVWSETTGRAIALRGDDASTPEVDGLLPGERVDLFVVLPSGPVPLSSMASTLDGHEFSDLSFEFESILIVQQVTSHSVDAEAPTPAVPPLTLSSPAPNPAHSSTTVPYSLGTEASVRAEVVDPLGRRVRDIVVGTRLAGDHQLELPLGEVAAGVYLVRLSARGPAGSVAAVTRLTVVR